MSRHTGKFGTVYTIAKSLWNSSFAGKHAYYTQTSTHVRMHSRRPALGSLLIPAKHTCLLGGKLCVTCWPYRNLTYEDYPETELQ